MSANDPKRTYLLLASFDGANGTAGSALGLFLSPNSINSLTKTLNMPWSDPGEFLMISLFVFIGVVWWVVGRIMRWGFYKIWGHT